MKPTRVFLSVQPVGHKRPAGADPFTYRDTRPSRWRASWWTRGTSTEMYRGKIVATREEAIRLARAHLDRRNQTSGDPWIDTTDHPERFGYTHEPAAKKDPPSLAAAARAAGHEPETEDGGRAMMQAITMEHLQHAESVRQMKKFKPGDEIKYTNFTAGGSYEGTAIVSWDHGKRVEARTLGGEGLTLERAKDGSLRRFT
jgi:hypothetical protein